MSAPALVLCAALAAAGAVLLGWPTRRIPGYERRTDRAVLWQRAGAWIRPERPAPVVELLSALAAELAAGQPTGAALVSAAVDLDPSPCAEAVAAAGCGGDVPAALRRDAMVRGGHPLRGLAACWEVAERSGAGLGAAVTRLAEGVRAAAEADAQLTAELAAVRTSARLLAGLPLLGLAIGQWIGAEPISWLSGGWLGRAVLLAGVCLQLVGITWLHVMVTRTRARL